METIAIIPAYNEERTIREVITRCKEVDIFPLVVDDSSTDRTWDISWDLTTTLSHIENKGKGECLQTAFDFINDFETRMFKIRSDYIVIIDADLQFDPYEIPRLIEVLKRDEVDYIIGQRDWSKVPLRHRLANYIWVKTFNFLNNTNLKDTNCGFVAMKMEVMRRLRVSSGYIVDNDMLIQVLKMGYKVKNIPVSVRYNHKRGLSGIRMVVGILIFIILNR